jgi:hypothetical protein
MCAELTTTRLKVDLSFSRMGRPPEGCGKKHRHLDFAPDMFALGIIRGWECRACMHARYISTIAPPGHWSESDAHLPTVGSDEKSRAARLGNADGQRRRVEGFT